AGDDKPERLVELAEWALAHGIVDNVAQGEHGHKIDGIPKIMDELAAVAPKHPAVVAFHNVQVAMEHALADAPKSDWHDPSRLGSFKRYESKPYTLFSDLHVAKEATRRLDRLEKNFRRFYYWFAVRGTEMPMPQHRLVAVLFASPEGFEQKRKN